MTKSTERARHASKPKSAVRHRKNKKRTGEAPKPAEGEVGKTDITPEAFFLAWGRRRKEALIEVLIDSLDAADGDPDLEDGGDREPDAGEEPEVENEHGDGNPDDEPSLGWTENVGQFISNTGAASFDLEADASYVTEAGRQRYKPFDRYSANGNRDGKHVDAERGYGYAKRRLTNLSDQQRAAVASRLNRGEVRI
jgi:hypothetical protein